jgi:hypothetical protein
MQNQFHIGWRKKERKICSEFELSDKRKYYHRVDRLYANYIYKRVVDVNLRSKFFILDCVVQNRNKCFSLFHANNNVMMLRMNYLNGGDFYATNFLTRKIMFS